MLKVIREGRKILGCEREVGELVPEDEIHWYVKKALVKSKTVEPASDSVEPVHCDCGRMFASAEDRDAAGHGNCEDEEHPGVNPLFRMKNAQLLEEARELEIDIESLPLTQSGTPKRTALISAVSNARG